MWATNTCTRTHTDTFVEGVFFHFALWNRFVLYSSNSRQPLFKQTLAQHTHTHIHEQCWPDQYLISFLLPHRRHWPRRFSPDVSLSRFSFYASSSVAEFPLSNTHSWVVQRDALTHSPPYAPSFIRYNSRFVWDYALCPKIDAHTHTERPQFTSYVVRYV